MNVSYCYHGRWKQVESDVCEPFKLSFEQPPNTWDAKKEEEKKVGW